MNEKYITRAMSILILFVIFVLLFCWTLWILHQTYIVEGLATKASASSAYFLELQKQRKAAGEGGQVNTSSVNTQYVGKDNSGFGEVTYSDRIVELQKLIDVLSNPNKSQTEKLDYLFSEETPFRLRNDLEIKQVLNNLQSCIKQYIEQIIVVNNQIRAKRPVPLSKFDQVNVCKGNECVRYDQADKIAKYLDENKLKFMKQVKYLLAPDFLLKSDPDYMNLLKVLQTGCIEKNIATILAFVKKVYKSWIENDSANLAIIKCKGKDMFSAECAENARKNAIKDPDAIAMNVQNATPRPKNTFKPPTIHGNLAYQGLMSTAKK
jgi:hypothetical protein